jgi:hypothetical protein
MEEVNRLIEQGMAATRANLKEEAEDLLNQAITLAPNNERAWLWLSAVVEGIERQRECLNRVLEINPSNAFARAGLSFLNHLRPGYEYMAARAPWVPKDEESHSPLTDLPSQKCPRCGTINPGWAYLCNRCSGVLEPVDVAKEVKREIRQERLTASSLVRPWSSAAVLDATRAFAPEVALASPLRAVLVVVMGTLALNLMRAAGALGILAFTSARQSFWILDRLTSAFVSDQIGLVIGALAAWALLALTTQAIVRSLGGLGSPRIHYYLVAVALSSWMPITGVTGLLWWTAALLIPKAPPPLLAALACGLVFFYLLTLVTQAIHTTHTREPLQETATIGALLLICTVAYAGLTAISPPGLQNALLKVMGVLLLPLQP